jgi:hypothetical protein
MKRAALALLVTLGFPAIAMNQPYWWGLTVGGTRVEFDLNNIRQITYAVRTAPQRITLAGGTQIMLMLTVNCVTEEVLRKGVWAQASPFDLSICR